MGLPTMAGCPTPEQLQYVHHNTTEGNESYSLAPWIPALLVSPVGLVGNGLVLWLLGFRIQRNPFSVYILNLAGADALFLCFLFLNIINRFVWNMDVPASLVLVKLASMFYTVGLSLLASISTERCLSVLFPIWYRCHRPKHTSAVVCTVLWAVTALLRGLSLVICYSGDNVNDCDHFYIIGFVWFLLFTPVMCVSSLTLLLKVHCSSRHLQLPRLYLVVLLNVLVFLLCGMPLGILSFLCLYHKGSMPFWLAPFLACVNSSTNPFIYFFLGIQRHRRRKDSLRVIFQRALGDEEEVEDEARNSPHNNTQESLS